MGCLGHGFCRETAMAQQAAATHEALAAQRMSFRSQDLLAVPVPRAHRLRNNSGAGPHPKNGPDLRKRACRRGRSREFSLQEGGATHKGQRRRPPQAFAPSCYALRVCDPVEAEAHIVTRSGVTAPLAAWPHPPPFPRSRLCLERRMSRSKLFSEPRECSRGESCEASVEAHAGGPHAGEPIGNPNQQRLQCRG